MIPVHFVRGGSYYHTPMTLTRAEWDQVRKPFEAAGYAAPNEHDPSSQSGGSLAPNDRLRSWPCANADMGEQNTTMDLS
ncbi:MAG TPA: hypothetical protein DEA08_01015 [Planctomycetes bacterium]|nr:hypothetical protein [Planctomycetota bacterium]|tara:strand:+ start:128 stop:364 length:237 start_codon:yes stop_codon:yes gene_type:complete